MPTKYTVTITAIALSKDSIPALVAEALNHLEMETPDGACCKDDGDFVDWQTEKEEVEF